MASDTTERITPAAASELQTLIVVSGAHLISHLHIMALPVLLPLLKEQMHVGFFELGLALTTFNVVTLAQAPLGILVDRVGGKAVLTSGLLLGGLAFLSLGFTTSYAWLLVAAALAGLANCVYHPADYAILNDSIAEDRIGRAFSIHTFAGFVGGAIAPPLLLGLATIGNLSWSLACAGLLAWATAAVVFLIPNHRRVPEHARASSAGATGGLAGVLTPAVLGLTGFFTLLALSNNAMFSFSVVALIAGHGVSLAVATAGLTAYLAGSAVGVLAGGVVADRTRRYGDVAGAGFALSAVITLVIALLTPPIPVLIMAMGAIGFLFGIIQPSRDMLVRKAAPPGTAGRVFGVVSTGFNIGGIVGPLLFGWLMDHGAPRWVFGAAVAFMAATAFMAFIEDRRPRRRAAAA